MNWLLIGVGVIFLIGMIVGYIRGFVKIVVSFGVTLATVVLVIAVTPKVAGVMKKYTPIDDMIHKKMEAMVTPKIGEIDFAGTELEGVDIESSGLTMEEIKEKLGTIEIPRQKQIELMENANIPTVFKNGLLENNNSEAYKVLKVSSFPEYVGAYLSDIVIKMVAFLLTFIIVTILVRAVIFALDIITALPVIKGLNRFAGGLVGLLIALIVVWIGFLVITLIYNTMIGKECFGWIAESEFLTFLYENNVILEFATKLK